MWVAHLIANVSNCKSIQVDVFRIYPKQLYESQGLEQSLPKKITETADNELENGQILNAHRSIWRSQFMFYKIIDTRFIPKNLNNDTLNKDFYQSHIIKGQICHSDLFAIIGDRRSRQHHQQHVDSVDIAGVMHSRCSSTHVRVANLKFDAVYGKYRTEHC